MQAKKGDWVQIHFIALNPEERSEHLPDDTKQLPLEIRIKGFLKDKEAELNEIVTIKTPIGRLIKGRLEKINPRYEHNFGEPMQELLHINSDILKIGDVDE